MLHFCNYYNCIVSQMKTLTTRTPILVLLFIFHAFTALSQKQGNIWYFGFGAGLDFNSGKPVELTDGKVFSIEGSASISDRNGHLLFYADGLYLYNREHKVMLNSFPLYGNTSATQSVAIAPLPDDTNTYYVFTIDAQAGPRGIEYSIINMKADSGRAEMISRNNPLYAPSCEKITLAPMAADTGYWVISHQFGSDSFVAYKLTARGLNKIPVKSKAGPIIDGYSDHAIGYIAVSPDWKKLAMASSIIGAHLFDFDKRTGKVSNAITIDTNTSDYGIAFSPDSKLLYISQNTPSSGSTPIQQYDLTAVDIPASKYNIVTPDKTRFGGMKLGPDNKIYIARATFKYLDIIQYPNKKGNACGYTNKGFVFNTGESYWGLPNTTPALVRKNTIQYITKCYKDTTWLYTHSNTSVDSFSWKIIFPNAKVQHFSKKDTVKEILTDTGTYKIILQSYNGITLSADSTMVHIQLTPDIKLGNDTLLCNSAPLTLNAPAGYTTYKWQDGSNGQSFSANQSGKYWVKAQTGNCIKSDTITVLKGNLNITKLKTLDTTVCPGFSFSKDVSQAGCNYLWNDGNTQAQRTFTKDRLYIVKISNPCAIVIDTFKIKILRQSVHYLGKDTIVCKEANYTLHATDSFPCVWQDGSTGSSIKVSKAGKYKVNVYRNCAIVSDSVNISFYPDIKPIGDIDTAICEGSTLHFNYVRTGAQYLWNDGYNAPERTIKTQGTFSCTAYNQCYTVTDAIHIIVQKPLKLHLLKDTSLCSGVAILLHAPDSASYLWQDGSKMQDLVVSKPGLYTLSATNACGTQTHSTKIDYIKAYTLDLPADTSLCGEDSIAVNGYSGPGNYLWDDGTKSSKRVLNKAGQYILTFNNQCQSLHDTINIKTDSFCHCFLYTPDIFTPDNNGINESWKPSSCSRYKSYLLQVYDRCGERVFTTSDLNEGWDGNFKGKKAMEGMYVYLIKLVDVHNSNSYKSGRFYLIRD